MKSKRSARGSIIDHEHNREHVTESTLEERALASYKANREVETVRDQWPKVAFLDREGRPTWHVFDYAITFVNRRIRVIAVRPKTSKELAELMENIELIRQQGVLAGIADEIEVVDETKAPDWAAWNGEEVLFYRRCRDEDDVAAALERAARLPRNARFADMFKGEGTNAARRAAAWNLVDEGVIRAVGGGALVEWMPIEVDLTRLQRLRSAK